MHANSLEKKKPLLYTRGAIKALYFGTGNSLDLARSSSSRHRVCAFIVPRVFVVAPAAVPGDISRLLDYC